jgi:hypothetical protein
MGSRYEKIAGVGDEGRSTVRYERDIGSLL